MSYFQSIYSYFFGKNVEKSKFNIERITVPLKQTFIKTFTFPPLLIEPNLGENLRVVMLGSEGQWRSIYPFLVTGLAAWPAFWLYRGYEWHKMRGSEPLPVYIKKVDKDEQSPITF